MKTIGLSVEQEKAALLIATSKINSDRRIAKEIGIEISTLATWKQDPKFRLRVLQLFEGKVNIEKTYRTKRTESYLRKVYRELHTKLENSETLRLMSFKDLLRTMALLQSELRLDENVSQKFLKDMDPKTDFSDKKDDDIEEEALARAIDQYDATRMKKVVPIRG
jgi:hypothetical protein